jgi:hypothetical protein
MQRNIYSLTLVVSMLAFGSTAALANSDAPKCSNGHPCTTISTQGGSTNTCNGNPGCATDTTESNKQLKNLTTKCTSPDSLCSK